MAPDGLVCIDPIDAGRREHRLTARRQRRSAELIGPRPTVLVPATAVPLTWRVLVHHHYPTSRRLNTPEGFDTGWLKQAAARSEPFMAG
jgi:hypothetical protein